MSEGRTPCVARFLMNIRVRSGTACGPMPVSTRTRCSSGRTRKPPLSMGSIPSSSKNWECWSQSWSFLLNRDVGGTGRLPSETPSIVTVPTRMVPTIVPTVFAFACATSRTGRSTRAKGSDSLLGDSLLGFLGQLEIVVLRQDALVGGAVIRHVGVVVSAQDVGRPVEWMVTDSPTPLGVTVHLAHAGIHTHAHGADQSGLAEIRAEAGPEVVIEIWAAVE